MRRPPLPAFIGDLFVDPVAKGALLAGSLALFAAALDPQVWSPALPSVQAAVRENPQLETTVMLASLSAAALLLLGGALGDSRRSRPIILGGLTVELLAGVAALFLHDGPLYVATRLIGHAGATFVIPVSIALVATRYRGPVRATAIGLAYGAYGAAGAAGPVLLQLIPGERWPAYVAAIVACAIAIRVASRHVLELHRPSLAERPLVVGVAVWAFGIITMTIGLTWIGGGLDNPIRWAMIVGGPALVLFYDRLSRKRQVGPVGIIRRNVAIALFVGVVIAVSQTAAMLNLPLYFRLVLGYGPVLAVAALAPLFAALVLAGPVAGYLLSRVSPRWLVGGGVVFVGIGNLVLAAVTTAVRLVRRVRPAVPAHRGGLRRGDDGSNRDHLRERAAGPARDGGGAQRGVDLGRVADRDRRRQRARGPGGHRRVHRLGGLAAGRRRERRDRGLPGRADRGRHAVVQPGRDHDRRGRRAALPRRLHGGLHAAFLFCGVIGVVGGAIALVAFGQQDPLKTVWDSKDERAATAAA